MTHNHLDEHGNNGTTIDWDKEIDGPSLVGAK